MICILSFFNLSTNILCDNFKTTQVEYMSKMAHEGIRTVKTGKTGRGRKAEKEGSGAPMRRVVQK
jgi:hypothetical protein